jgi:tetratricopeptide (TPR) repeat protein
MQFFRTYLDWVEAKPAESLARVHRLAAAIDRIPEDFRRTFTSTLIWNYLALGRLSEAQELAERGRVWEGPEPYLLAYVLRERGNLAGLRDYLTTHWTHEQSSKATGDPWRVEFLVPAGMLEEAERDIDGYISQVPAAAVETSFYPFLMGPLEMARGRPDEAVRFLQLWLGAAPNRAIALHNAQWQAQKLAAAWEALGDRPTAIEVLETGEHPPAFVVVRHQWLTSKAQLARLYRKNGQEQKARVVEARLLKMLAVADADHPLLKELNARR